MTVDRLLEEKKFESNKYRTQMHSLGDVLDVILNAGREGVIISSISRRANLSHYPTMDKCGKLLSAGLIKSNTDNGKNVFFITEKGYNFITEYRKFQDLIESMNLRY
ncbi:MAG: transcriptional regulator [Nitrosopumilus sp.]|nr:transcriptional regulator [Nitrosopumilus sp.]